MAVIISTCFRLLDSAINWQQDPCYMYISHCTLSTSLHYLVKLPLRRSSTFSKLLMVSVGVPKCAKTNVIFIDPEVKINGA